MTHAPHPPAQRSHSNIRNPPSVIPALQLPSEARRKDYMVLHAESARHLNRSSNNLAAGGGCVGQFPPINYRAQTSRLNTFIQQSNALLTSKSIITKAKFKLADAPDREIRLLVQEMKIASSRALALQRSLELVRKSASAAYEFFQFLFQTQWKQARKWFFSDQSTVTRRTLLTLVWYILDYAFQDVKREQCSSKMPPILPEISKRSHSSSRCSQMTSYLREGTTGNLSARTKTEREPLKNITNTAFPKSQKEKHNRTAHGIFRGILEEEKEEPVFFKKSDLLWLMSSKYLFELILMHIQNSSELMDRKQVQNFIELLVQIALKFKNRELYDTLALKVTNAGIFQPFMKVLKMHPVEPSDYKGVARILELCACHQQGITILNDNIDLVIDLVARFIKSDPQMASLIYPSATVLLDLTASQLCIERVAVLMQENSLYPIIMDGARHVLFAHFSQPQLSSRLRDLLIGILLNLTCNVENQELNKNLIDLGVIQLLNRILVDQRNDWPSNGSALALLQYCHLGVSDSDVFKHLESAATYDTMHGYLEKAKNPETRRHLHEALNLYQIGLEKKKSIEHILETRFFAPCA